MQAYICNRMIRHDECALGWLLFVRLVCFKLSNIFRHIQLSPFMPLSFTSAGHIMPYIDSLSVVSILNSTDDSSTSVYCLPTLSVTSRYSTFRLSRHLATVCKHAGSRSTCSYVYRPHDSLISHSH